MIKILCDEANDCDIICEEVTKVLGLKGELMLDLSFVSEEEIAFINNEFRDKNQVTDVLSFPLLECKYVTDFRKNKFPLDYDSELKAVNLGSIVICSARANQQAEEYGHSYKREVSFLFLHGLLHLLGYDHIVESDEKEMFSLAEKILANLSINR